MFHVVLLREVFTRCVNKNLSLGGTAKFLTNFVHIIACCTAGHPIFNSPSIRRYVLYHCAATTSYIKIIKLRNIFLSCINSEPWRAINLFETCHSKFPRQWFLDLRSVWHRKGTLSLDLRLQKTSWDATTTTTALNNNSSNNNHNNNVRSKQQH